MYMCDLYFFIINFNIWRNMQFFGTFPIYTCKFNFLFVRNNGWRGADLFLSIWTFLTGSFSLLVQFFCFFLTVNFDGSLPLEVESLTSKILVLFLNIQTLPLGKQKYLHSIILCMKGKKLKSLSLYIIIVIKLESCHRKVFDQDAFRRQKN